MLKIISGSCSRTRNMESQIIIIIRNFLHTKISHYAFNKFLYSRTDPSFHLRYNIISFIIIEVYIHNSTYEDTAKSDIIMFI